MRPLAAVVEKENVRQPGGEDHELPPRPVRRAASQNRTRRRTQRGGACEPRPKACTSATHTVPTGRMDALLSQKRKQAKSKASARAVKARRVAALCEQRLRGRQQVCDKQRAAEASRLQKARAVSFCTGGCATARACSAAANAFASNDGGHSSGDGASSTGGWEASGLAPSVARSVPPAGSLTCTKNVSRMAASPGVEEHGAWMERNARRGRLPPTTGAVVMAVASSAVQVKQSRRAKLQVWRVDQPASQVTDKLHPTTAHNYSIHSHNDHTHCKTEEDALLSCEALFCPQKKTCLSWRCCSSPSHVARRCARMAFGPPPKSNPAAGGGGPPRRRRPAGAFLRPLFAHRRWRRAASPPRRRCAS